MLVPSRTESTISLTDIFRELSPVDKRPSGRGVSGGDGPLRLFSHVGGARGGRGRGVDAGVVAVALTPRLTAPPGLP